VPLEVKAHTGCQVVKTSDGNLVQKGGGNTYTTNGSGGFPGSTLLNGTTQNIVTVGNPGIVVPSGVNPSKVTVTYFVSINGTSLGSFTLQQLQTSPLVFNKPTNSQDTLTVGVDLFEQSGTQTNISQYRVTVDVTC
jgi:hypothetical protein